MEQLFTLASLWLALAVVSALIAYYLSGLIGYIFKGLQEMGWLRNSNIAAALFVPVAIGLALLITNFSRKYLHKKLSGEPSPSAVEKPQV